MTLKLSAIASAVAQHGADISSAVSAEVKVTDKWVALGRALYTDGVRVAMLVKSTEKSPNPLADETLINTIMQFVVAGLSSARKGLEYRTPNPRAPGKEQVRGHHRWTVSDLLSLSAEEVRAIEDETLKNARRHYQQIAGTMLNRIRFYVDRQENPDKTRESGKGKGKTETKAETPSIPRTVAGFMFALNDMNANINMIGLSARDAENIRDALLDTIARLKAAKAAMAA